MLRPISRIQTHSYIYIYIYIYIYTRTNYHIYHDMAFTLQWLRQNIDITQNLISQNTPPWHGDTFRIIGPMGIPSPMVSSQRVNDAEFYIFVCCLFEQTAKQTVQLPLIRDTTVFIWSHCNRWLHIVLITPVIGKYNMLKFVTMKRSCAV